MIFRSQLSCDGHFVRPQRLLILLLGGLTLTTYLPALRCGFVGYDDDGFVTQNPNVTGGLSFTALKGAFITFPGDLYIPLTQVSFQLDAQLYALNPAGFHFTNVLLHTINVLLLYCFLQSATGSTWRSAAVAAVFAVHPLRVESVVWVSERKDVLSMFFGLLSLIAYVRYARQPTWRKYGLVVVSFTMCLLSKSMLVTLPCVFLLLDFWPLGRLGVLPAPLVPQPAPRIRIGRLLLEKIPMLVPMVAVAGVTYLRQRSLGYAPINFSDRVANAFFSYVRYLEKMVRFDHLIVFYPFKPVAAVIALLSGAAILLLTIGALLQWRSRPWLTVGWLWYVGTLVPVIGLVAVGGIAMANRFSYFPTIGVLIMLLWSVPDPTEQRSSKFAYAAAVGVVCLLLSAITRGQIDYWKDPIALWEHDLSAGGECPLAEAICGGAYLENGQPAGAVPHLRAATRLCPTDFRLHADLATALFDVGDLKGAVDEDLLAVRLNPTDGRLYCDLADALAVERRRAEAVACYRRALQIDRNNAKAQECLRALTARSTSDTFGAMAQ